MLATETLITTFTLTGLTALEILDSRGRPTLAVTVLSGGSSARAGVPSGASTGTREAVELRDGDPRRYAGAGVLTAAGNVNGELADALTGRSWSSLAQVDQAMRDLDGTRPGWGRTRSSGCRWRWPGRWRPRPASRCTPTL